MTTAELLANLRFLRDCTIVDMAQYRATIDEAIRRIETTSPGSLNDVQGIRS